MEKRGGVVSRAETKFMYFLSNRMSMEKIELVNISMEELEIVNHFKWCIDEDRKM